MNKIDRMVIEALPIRFDKISIKRKKSPFNPIITQKESLLDTVIQEVIPKEQIRSKNIAFMGSGVNGISSLMTQWSMPRSKLDIDTDILFVGDLVPKQEEKISQKNNLYVIQLFNKNIRQDFSSQRDYLSWADDHYSFDDEGNLIRLTVIEKDVKPDISQVDGSVDKTTEPQTESVFFDPAFRIYLLDGDLQIEIYDFYEYLRAIKNLPVTIAFVYESEIGIFLTISRYVKGNIPSKKRQKEIIENLRNISLELAKKVDISASDMDKEVVAIQNAITVVNKSKKTIRTPYSRTIKAKTDSYPLDELKKHGKNFAEEVTPYLDPKRVFNEK